MKKERRIRFFALFLSMLTVISMLPATAIAADSENELNYQTVEVVATPESSVSVRVLLKNNTGVAGILTTIEFDDDDLALKSVSYSGAYSNGVQPDELTSPVSLVWYAADDVTDDGLFAIIEFDVKASVTSTKKEIITFSYSSEDVINSDFEPTNLTLKFMECLPGDINYDGKVGIADPVRLLKLLNEKTVKESSGGSFEYDDIKALDVTGNGKFSIQDVVRLGKYLAKSEVELYYGTRVTKQCRHTLESVAAAEPTCTTDGNIAYFTCTKCGKRYADGSGVKEITAYETILPSGHTYTNVWSNDETNHWHSATCGHTVIADYNKHDFDANDVCTVCGYVRQTVDYKDTYLKYSEIGKTVNLITASDFMVAPGAKRLFTDAIYRVEPDVYTVGDQSSAGKSFSSFSSYAEESALNISAKISFGSRKDKNNRFMTNKLPSIDISGSYSYDSKKASETSEYIYSWDYVLGGTRVDISEFQNKEKLAAILSPEFISDAQKIKDGEMSAADFVKLWGTHVITSGIYGARLNVNYYEISNNVSDYSSYRAALDAKFSKRFLKSGLDIEASGDFSEINSSCEKDAIKKLSITGTAKNTFVCASMDDLTSAYQTWQANFEKDTEGNSVLVDIGDSGLCCIWYLLDDSFDDVKTILDEYMFSQCSDLYNEYCSKINNLKKHDDVAFNKDSGTLELNFDTFQKQGSIADFSSDNYVSYDKNTGVLSIAAYYNGIQIKRIVINGAYGTNDLVGQRIEQMINNVSIKLMDGDWYDNLQIELSNVGIIGSKTASTIDLTAIGDSNQVTILCVGDNMIVGHDGTTATLSTANITGQIALNANNILIKSIGSDDTLVLRGGNGATLTQFMKINGGDGGISLKATSVSIDFAGDLTIVGGNGGAGGTGLTGSTGSVGSPDYKTDNGSSNQKKNGGDGGTGGTGGIGGKGYSGGAGAAGVVTDVLNVFSAVKFVSGNGGNGGTGGTGGTGGRGGNGEGVWRFNNSYGGDGGTGGNGGTGGTGGTGGDSHFAVSAKTVNVADPSLITIVSGTAGKGGSFGKGGSAGAGGSKGIGRSGAGGCSISHCGSNGSSGSSGPNGVVGSDGIVQQGTLNIQG